MAPPRQLPLSNSELASLTAALGKRSIDGALGILAAVVSVPTMLPTQLWLGELMSGSRANTTEEVQRIVELFMKLNNFVSQSLMNRQPRAFFPDLEDDNACREFVTDYMRTIAQAGVDPSDKGKIGQGLSMLFGYSQITDKEMKKAGQKDPAAFRATVRSGLPEIIGVMHMTWLEQRTPPAASPRSEAKPERNGPCPCGSGKKFKKCHGANA